MEKTIYFTLYKCACGVVIKTDNHVDEDDEERVVQHTAVFNTMAYLSEKYNDRGYAVLFETE